jgi:hypothetical protein
MKGQTGLALLLVSMIGCRDGDAGYLVRGGVSLDGQPIASGTINFFPQDGKPLGGPLDPDGTYEFRLPAGEYRVTFRVSPTFPPGWKEGDAVPASSTPALPAGYSRPDTSGLTLTVVAQDEPLVADFPLETK